MPLHFTEYVRERLRSRGDATLARFLDIFHHRLLALFYRAWADAQPAVHHDRPGSDRFGAWLGASFGVDDASHAPRALPEKARLFQAGLLGSRSRHAEGLVKLLRQYFHVPVRIEQHVAQWLVSSRTTAAASASRAAARSDAMRSRRSWACRRRAARSVATASTSSGSRSARSRSPAITTSCPAARPGCGCASGCSTTPASTCAGMCELTLAADQVPEPRLGRAVRLGVSAWIGRRDGAQRGRDRNDLRLRPDTSFLLRRNTGARHA